MNDHRHIIVEGDELYHYGIKGMKWKDHVYATVEKAGNAVKTSAKKAAGAASAFAKKFGKKAKSAGVTAYERIRKKQHEANVKSGYKLKPKTDTAKTIKTAKGKKRTNITKADALATQEARRKSEMRRSADWHNNKNINKHVNKTDYKAVRADEERVRKSENAAYSAQRQKAEKQAARNRVVSSAHGSNPQHNMGRYSETNTGQSVKNITDMAYQYARPALNESNLSASQKARVYGLAKNMARESVEARKKTRRK